ncbi:hypothetical protein [Halorubrum tropicale]|jgi:hypothetical protein|uniref:hypothetical protein n=1 Tax=Halorubrum tropicale TaxID=1765655 RepID=UPI000A8EC7B5|nr:hypothetical protein [Halorubrum tropicale]
MRINTSEKLKEEHIDNSVRVNLSRGYERGFWNQNHGAVLLVSADSISTVIPENDLGLSEDMEQCCSCEALIMEECYLDNCRWCGEVDFEEPATHQNLL